jgi:tetratricopeptide (TPR) repeat protein
MQSMGKLLAIPPAGSNHRLDSWKEIAAFFGRDERTVKRWEKERGLPVHRLPGTSKAGVFAYANELSDWLKPPEPAGLSPALPAAEKSVEVPAYVVAPPPVRQSGVSWAPIAALAAVTLAALAAIAWNYPLASRQAAAHVTNPEAEDLYLKGRYHWNKRTPDDLNQAVDLFTQAIVHDPGYAKAYAGLADTYNLLREFSPMPSNEAFSRSLAAARRAVELDPGLADAHNSLAFASFYGAWDFASGEREYQQAIALDPKYATAYQWYANSLLSLGRFDEAIAKIDRARQIDPHSASILADRGYILYFAGLPTEGLALLQQLAADDPQFQSPHRYLALIYLLRADYPKYLAEARLRAELSRDGDGLASVAAGEKGLAAGGARGLLEATLEGQKALYEADRLPAYSVAHTAALLGRKPEALHYLHAALEKHEMYLVALGVDPFFAGLHGEPGFADVLARVGLPPKHR